MKNEFLELGVHQAVLDQINLGTIDCHNLYNTLKRFAAVSCQNKLNITEVWPIQALIGDFSFCEKQEIRTDEQGLTPFHYAAFCGDLMGLEKALKKIPDLLDKPNAIGQTPAHFAAAAGDPLALSWFNRNAPQLLSKNDAFDMCILHYAAGFGKPTVLNWILKVLPHLLYRIDIEQRHVGHLAVLSAKKNNVDWVKWYAPQLFKETDCSGRSMAEYARLSGKEELSTYICELINASEQHTMAEALKLLDLHVNILRQTSHNNPNKLNALNELRHKIETLPPSHRSAALMNWHEKYQPFMTKTFNCMDLFCLFPSDNRSDIEKIFQEVCKIALLADTEARMQPV